MYIIKLSNSYSEKLIANTDDGDGGDDGGDDNDDGVRSTATQWGN